MLFLLMGCQAVDPTDTEMEAVPSLPSQAVLDPDPAIPLGCFRGYGEDGLPAVLCPEKSPPPTPR